MNEQNLGKRPIIISIICICAAIFVVATVIALVFSSGARNFFLANIATSASYLGLLVSFVNLVALVGYWKMRRWGVYLYAAGVIASVLFATLNSSFSVTSLIVPVAIVAIGLLYFKRMS